MSHVPTPRSGKATGPAERNGEKGIRTLGVLLTHIGIANQRLRPLSHLSHHFLCGSSTPPRSSSFERGRWPLRSGGQATSWDDRTRTYATRYQKPLPYQLGYIPNKACCSMLRSFGAPALWFPPSSLSPALPTPASYAPVGPPGFSAAARGAFKEGARRRLAAMWRTGTPRGGHPYRGAVGSPGGWSVSEELSQFCSINNEAVMRF